MIGMDDERTDTNDHSISHDPLGQMIYNDICHNITEILLKVVLNTITHLYNGIKINLVSSIFIVLIQFDILETVPVSNILVLK